MTFAVDWALSNNYLSSIYLVVYMTMTLIDYFGYDSFCVLLEL